MLLALIVGVVGGLAIVAGNPVVPFIALIALLVLPLLVTRPMAGMVLVVSTITLLPYAVSPVRLAVLTPTLLEIGLLLLYVAWFLHSLLNTGAGFQRTPIDLWLLLFLGCTLFSLVLGLARDASTEVVHNYSKLILAVVVFFAIVNIIKTPQQMALVMRSLIILGGIAASLGLVLWRLPDTTASGLLSRLAIIGYPTDRIIRYVEDNPALGERAVGTQVDPNSFGGMLVVIAVLTGVQLLARKPLLPRWLLGGLLLIDVATLLLTQSRSALGGLLAAGVLVATMRHRRLWVWGVLALVPILAFGFGSGYLARLGAGLRFQDQASLMRLAEYSNAFDIITHYPAFGVGFGTAGELALTTGVSSVYLTIAERTGLIGLFLFLATIFVFFRSVIPAITSSRKHAPDPGSQHEREWSVLDTTLLGCTAAVLGVLVVSIVDHYYFNIEFPHMAALLWLVIGLALTARRLLQDEGRSSLTSNQEPTAM